MADRLWAWCLREGSGQHRLVLLTAVTVRVAAILTVGYGLPLVWPQLPRPGAALALFLAIVGQTAVVVGRWLARRRVGSDTFLADLPFGVVALLAGAALARPAEPVGWTWFAYPYLVLIGFSLGLAAPRAAAAVAGGAVWASSAVAAAWVIRHAPPGPALGFAPGLLVNPLVGWFCATSFRRIADSLERSRAATLCQEIDLAAARERARHARALHDRVLQTLEALARGSAVADPQRRAAVAEQAAWLRGYLETGLVDGADDLADGLAAVARAAQREGIRVELHDAGLRFGVPGTRLPGPGTQVLVEATHETVVALGRSGASVVVRAAAERGGVLVTVLAVGAVGPMATAGAEPAGACRRVVEAGGRATIDPMPYVELWLPGGPGPDGQPGVPTVPDGTGAARRPRSRFAAPGHLSGPRPPAPVRSSADAAGPADRRRRGHASSR